MSEQCERRFTMTCEDCQRHNHFTDPEPCVDFRCDAIAGHEGRHVRLSDTYSLSWDRTKDEPR